MAISPSELPALLEAIARRAEDAAPAAAMEMAQAFTDHVTQVTLRRSSHSPLSKTPAPEGGPPAWVSGHLAGTFEITPGPSGGGIGSAFSGPTAVYGRAQQMGADIFPKNRRFLMWKTDYPTNVTNFLKSGREGGGLFLNFAGEVHLPDRDYMHRGLDEVIASGELERRKIAVFMARVWG